jgi:hypothetical protein
LKQSDAVLLSLPVAVSSGRYVAVIRDTQRTCALFDLIRECAERKRPLSLRTVSPYVLMMNTRARAACCSITENSNRALEQIQKGIERIEDFFLAKSSAKSLWKAAVKSLPAGLERPHSQQQPFR